MQSRFWLPIAALAAILVVPWDPFVARADEAAEAQDEYERAVAQLKSAIQIKDFGLRERQLDKAQESLEEFLAKQPKHRLATKAMNELGNLLVQRAGAQVERAKRPAAVPDQKVLLSEAQGKYEKAIKLFATMEVDLKATLEALPKALDPRADAKQIEQRDQLRGDYLQAQILVAAAREEMAETEARGSMAYKDILLAAAKQYQVIYEKYRTRLAGLYARLYQARCFAKMNDPKEALARLDILFDMPDQPREFRDLKVQTLLLATEYWFAAMPQNYEGAIRRIGPFLELVPPDEKKEEKFLALQLWLGKAYQAQSEDIQGREPENKTNIAESLQKAKELFRFVSEHASDVQAEAKKALQKLGDAEGTADARPEPKNFAEFKAAGKEALETMQSATLRVAELTGQIANEKDAARKASLEKRLADTTQTIQTARAEAFKHFRLALRRATPDTDIDDLNVIQYFLTFLHYNQGDFHESAVLGEHVARRYPESAGARQCAKIAMASHLRIYKESKETSKAFESAKITGIAEYIVAKWPLEPEAIEALNTIIPFKIKEGKLEEAEAYLAKIPEDSVARGETELKVGQSLWSTYLLGEPVTGDGEPKGPAGVVVLGVSPRLEKVKKQAEKLLSVGIARAKKSGQISATLSMGVLSLAQLYVETNQSEKAIALLEDPKIGALTLVQRKDPTMMKDGSAEETLKTAVRAYVGSLEDGEEASSDATIRKIEKVIAALREIVAETPAGRKRLVSLCASLSNQLKAQIVDIVSPDIKKTLSKTIVLFETVIKENEK